MVSVEPFMVSLEPFMVSVEPFMVSLEPFMVSFEPYYGEPRTIYGEPRTITLMVKRIAPPFIGDEYMMFAQVRRSSMSSGMNYIGHTEGLPDKKDPTHGIRAPKCEPNGSYLTYVPSGSFASMAEKKTKTTTRKPRKPRTASIVVCNLLTHRNLASRRAERKNENDPQKAQKAQFRRSSISVLTHRLLPEGAYPNVDPIQWPT